MTYHRDQTIEIGAYSALAFQETFHDAMNGFVSAKLRGGRDYIFLAAECADNLSGYVKIQDAPTDLYIECLEVHPDYRGHGLGPRLFAETFRLAQTERKSLVLSPFTHMGKKHLLPHIANFQKQYPKVVVGYEQAC